MINLENISHRFGKNEVLKNVSFKVKQGKVLALLGENGAGKTTLMRICSTYVKPTSGKVYIHGKDVAENPVLARKSIGYMPEGAPLYSDMSVRAFLKFVVEAKNTDMSGKVQNTEIDRIVFLASLEKVVNQETAVLSKGYRRRVALAAAIASDPDVLLLDEPAEGLDPNQKSDFIDCLKKMNKAVIISTHVLEDIKSLASEMIILHEGRVKYQALMDSLKDKDLNQIFRRQTI